MDKKLADIKLTRISKSIEGAIWLLEKCNHSHNRNTYAHHVRDRISESIVDDFQQLVVDIQSLQSEINVDVTDSINIDTTPF
jgi:hypothetical protein